MPDGPSSLDFFPVRELRDDLKVSKSTEGRIRTLDPDYLELVTEVEIGGVKMIARHQYEAFLQRKLERAQALKAAAAQPVKRKPGRPRKALNTVRS